MMLFPRPNQPHFPKLILSVSFQLTTLHAFPWQLDGEAQIASKLFKTEASTKNFSAKTSGPRKPEMSYVTCDLYHLNQPRTPCRFVRPGLDPVFERTGPQPDGHAQARSYF
jgi:hypothetical protein